MGARTVFYKRIRAFSGEYGNGYGDNAAPLAPPDAEEARRWYSAVFRARRFSRPVAAGPHRRQRRRRAKPAAAAPPAAAATTAPAAAAPAAPASAATAATKPVTTGQRITIRDHDWIQGNPGQQGDWYDAFIAKFEDAHPDIKIEREWFPRNDMHAKELALAATGQIGDTVRINLAPLVSELQLKGVVRDLNSLYAERPAVGQQRPEAVLDGQPQDLYPRRQVVGAAGGRAPGAVQYYVNTTMVQKLGLKMPPADGSWTFDDMLTLAKGLTKSEGGRTTVYGIIPPVSDTTTNEGMVGFLRAFGGDLFDADGKKCLLNSDQSKAGLKALADLYSSGAAYPWAPDISEQTPELFQSQKVGMVIQTSFAASSWPGQIAKRPDPFEMDVFPNPLGPTGKHATQVSSDGKACQHGQQEPGQGLDRPLAAVHGPAPRDRALHQRPRQPGQPLRRVGQRRSSEGRRPSWPTSPRSWCCHPRRTCCPGTTRPTVASPKWSRS